MADAGIEKALAELAEPVARLACSFFETCPTRAAIVTGPFCDRIHLI